MKKIVILIFAMCLSVSMVQAQEKDKNKDKSKDKSKEKVIQEEPNLDKLFVKLKDDAKPDIYVDDKKFEFPIALIDQSKIESVFVIKDAKKLEKYNSPNGVVLITTKMKKKSTESELKIKGEGKEPKIIIDGKVTKKAQLDNMDPSDIESINVIKDEQAVKKYNAPNGVIIITTKK